MDRLTPEKKKQKNKKIVHQRFYIYKHFFVFDGDGVEYETDGEKKKEG